MVADEPAEEAQLEQVNQPPKGEHWHRWLVRQHVE